MKIIRQTIIARQSQFDVGTGELKITANVHTNGAGEGKGHIFIMKQKAPVVRLTMDDRWMVAEDFQATICEVVTGL